MRIRLGIVAGVCISYSVLQGGQPAGDDETVKVPLNVPAGAPLRLYLTKRVSKQAGVKVEAKTLEPVFAFDREVIPAGSVVSGKVSRVQPFAKWQRFRAIVNGDFTPLRNALVEFNNLTLPDGKSVPIRTIETVGLHTIYTEPGKKKKPAGPQKQNGGILGTARRTVKDRLNGAINARSRGVADIVRGPNKREKLADFLWSKLPYHPQRIRRGTRFDAPLVDELHFGSESVTAAALTDLGSQPSADSVARARLLTALDSASAKPGLPVNAVLTAPLFSANHKLVLPEGTRLVGAVTMARKARSFHRAGRLRFNFQKLDLPPEIANLGRHAPAPEPLKTQAMLLTAEGSGTAPLKVDAEGGVQAKESKTRFLAPMISLLVASRAADNDAGRHHDTGGAGTDTNVSGRTLGGASGFGFLGAAASQSSRYVGMAFGYYGVAWSVYSNVVARGGEVQFDKNAMIDIQFGARRPAQGSKFRGVMTAMR